MLQYSEEDGACEIKIPVGRLEVRCSNNDAVRLYEKLGFVIKQQLNAYYRDGEDAFLMAIELN